MAAVGWSTAVLLVALLPGFAFLFGASILEPFGRDSTPRRPLGQLAITVLVSLLTHAVLIWLCAFVSSQPLVWGPFVWGSSIWGPSAWQCSSVRPVDLEIALGALYADKDRIGGLAESFATDAFRISGYVLVSVGVPLLAGFLTTALAKWLRRGIHLISEHAWLYEAAGVTSTYPAVHVLTSVSHEGKRMMYSGTLERFSVRTDGKVAYLVLKKPMKYLMDINVEMTKKATPKTSEAHETPGVPKTSEPTPIVGAGIDIERLYIDGDSVENVFFGREEPPRPKGVEARIPEMDREFEKAEPFPEEPPESKPERPIEED